MKTNKVFLSAEEALSIMGIEKVPGYLDNEFRKLNDQILNAASVGKRFLFLSTGDMSTAIIQDIRQHYNQCGFTAVIALDYKSVTIGW